MATEVDPDRLSPSFKVAFAERPTYSLLRTKAGIIGRPIKETSGTVADQVAARSGVIRVGNGFRCPDNTQFGGTFTDASGSTCGARIVLSAVESLAGQVPEAVSSALKPRTDPTRDVRQRTDIPERIRDEAERVASMLASTQSFSRVRLSVDDMLPEAFDDDDPITKVTARRPGGPLYSVQMLGSGEQPTNDIADSDRESDRYLRSLGYAAMRQIQQRHRQKNVPIVLGASLAEALERKRHQQEVEDRLRTQQRQAVSRLQEQLDWLSDDITSRGPFFGLYGAVTEGPDGSLSLAKMSSNQNELRINRFTRQEIVPLSRVEITLDMGEAKSDTSFGWSDRKELTASVQIPHHEQLGISLQPKIVFTLWDGGELDLPIIPDPDSDDPAARAAYDIQQALLVGVPNPDDPYDDPVSPLTELLDNQRRFATEFEPLVSQMANYRSGENYQRELYNSTYELLAEHGFQRAVLDPRQIRVTDEDPLLLSRDGTRGIAIHADSFYGNDETAALEQALDNVLGAMPAWWAEALYDRGVVIFSDHTDRSWARSKGSSASALINLNERIKADADAASLESILLHELVHVVQAENPEMTEAEFVLGHLRIEADPRKERLTDMYPGYNYKDEEIAYPDDVDNAYELKEYRAANSWDRRPTRLSELSPMLMEMIYQRKERFGGDLDAIAWMFGMLLEQGRGSR